MSLVESSHRGYETYGLAGCPLGFEVGAEIGGVFVNNHFMCFGPQNRTQRRFYRKNCTFANYLALNVLVKHWRFEFINF